MLFILILRFGTPVLNTEYYRRFSAHIKKPLDFTQGASASAVSCMRSAANSAFKNLRRGISMAYEPTTTALQASIEYNNTAGSRPLFTP